MANIMCELCTGQHHTNDCEHGQRHIADCFKPTPTQQRLMIRDGLRNLRRLITETTWGPDGYRRPRADH